jgi:hypothetical protein
MIIDLQRRLAEVGRLRIGQLVTSANGKTRPAKLDTWRLTSADGRRIAHAVELYGGTLTRWDAPTGPQYEVITTTDTLPVIVPPGNMAFTQHYELWAAGGCQRRCDGVTATFNDNGNLQDGECLCDPDNRECAIHSRLSVMLRDLPGLGVWRIDTQGYYAAVELAAAVDVIHIAAGRGHLLPATLRLEQRMTKRPGQGTRRFAVPVLDIDIPPGELIGGGDPRDAGTLAIEPPADTPRIIAGKGEYASHNEYGSAAPLTPVPATDDAPRPVADQIANHKPRPRRKGTATVPPTGLAPRTAAETTKPAPPPTPPAAVPDKLITPAQTTKLSILLAAEGLNDHQAAIDWLSSAIHRNVTSRKQLTTNEAIDVIDLLETAQAQGK